MTTLPVAAEADHESLQQAARGDERAAGRLYDRFGALLYAVAYRITRDATDAEEAVAEAFSQAWRSAAGFDPARGALPAWLTMICRSRALDLVRARTRRERATAQAQQAAPDEALAMGRAADEPSRHVEEAEREQVVRAALAELSAPQRQAIELAFYEGLSHSEIAARTGEPLGTVKTRVRLGMQKLRERLRPLMADSAA